MFGIDDAIGGIFTFASKVLDRAIPDPQAKAQAQLELAKMQQTGELAQLTADTDLLKGQLQINLAEAASSSLFVAGWRPAFGWVCASIYAYTFIIYPTAKVVLAGWRPEYLTYFPVLSLDEVWPVATGLLGIGTLRTYEKLKGVAR